MNRFVALIVTTAFLATSSTWAATLFYEDFDYEAPATQDNNGNELPSPWVTARSSGNPAAPRGIDLAESGLDFGAMPVAGKSAFASTSRSRSERAGDFSILLNNSLNNSGDRTFYLSYLIRSPNVSATGWGNNATGVILTPSQNDNRDGFGAGIMSDADGSAGGAEGADYFFLSVGSRINKDEGETHFFIADALGQPLANTTYLMVAKFVFHDSNNSADGYLKVFTDFADVPMDADPASWDLTATGVSLPWGINGHPGVDRIGVDRDNNINEVYMDEIRVGDTWGDVVVPEPASLAVLGLGSLVALRRRRRVE
jgi:hypothetical protein